MGNKVKAASTLSIQPKILCKGLSNTHLKPSVGKVPDGPSVVIKVPGGKTLICAIKEWEMPLLGKDLGNLDPLLTGRIDTCGVVCTDMEKYYRAFRCSLESFNHAGEIKAFRGCIPIWVSGGGKVHIAKYLKMVTPSGIRKVNLLVLGSCIVF